MNCINCGAPTIKAYCQYCGTGAQTIVSGTVDQVLYKKHLKMFQNCAWDEGRVQVAKTLAHQDYRYTAGQVRGFARVCSWDEGKVAIFYNLRRNIENLPAIMESGDIMAWDEGRSKLAKISTGQEFKSLSLEPRNTKYRAWLTVAFILLFLYVLIN